MLLLALTVAAWAQDYEVLSRRDIAGSARYVGMSGAMTAIGTDVTAAFDNPATLGMYSGMDAHIAMDIQIDRTRPQDASQWCDSRNTYVPTVAAAVYAFTTTRKEASYTSATSVTLEDVPYLQHGIMVGFHRLKNYKRTSATLLEDPVGEFQDLSVGPCRMQTYEFSEETGYINDFAISYGLGVKERFFFGVGLDIYDFRYGKSMRYDRRYYPINDVLDDRGRVIVPGSPYSRYPYGTLPLDETPYYDDFASSLSLRGVGASLRVGILGRPNDWLSVGLAVQTPSVSSLKQYDNRDYRTDDEAVPMGIRQRYSSVSRSGYHMPMQYTIGVGFHALQYVSLSIQYDGSWLRSLRPMHTFKAGVEIRPVERLSITLGGAYESSLKDVTSDYFMDAMRRDRPGMVSNDRYQRMYDTRSDYDYRHDNYSYYISGGIGYVGQFFQIALAYQYRRQSYDLYPNVYVRDDGSFDRTDYAHALFGDSHRIVFSLGITR